MIGVGAFSGAGRRRRGAGAAARTCRAPRAAECAAARTAPAAGPAPPPARGAAAGSPSAPGYNVELHEDHHV